MAVAVHRLVGLLNFGLKHEHMRMNLKPYSESSRESLARVAGGVARLTADCRLVAGYCLGQYSETTARVYNQTCGSKIVFMLQSNSEVSRP